LIKEKLSESSVRGALCPVEVKSIDLPDGNGLELRVSRKGMKVWRYRYKVGSAKKTLTIGTYPEISLKEARKQRDKLILLRKAGLDPSLGTGSGLEEKPIAEIYSVSKAMPHQDSGTTFKDLVDEYLKTLTTKSSHKEVSRALYKDLVPDWGKRDPEGITLRECVLLLDKIARRAPVLSDRLYSYLKRAYAVGMQRGLITVNPLVNVQKPAPEAEIRDNSQKVLTHSQLQGIVHSIKQTEVTMMDDALMMVLWTGARPSEVLNMQWRQIEGEQWTLGVKEHKGGHRRPRTITRPLNASALAILKRYTGENELYVFPGRFGTPSSHIRLSRHVRDNRHHYGIKPFTPNHLRHTISTRMREIGIRPDIVERIIGHHVDSGIVGV